MRKDVFRENKSTMNQRERERELVASQSVLSAEFARADEALTNWIRLLKNRTTLYDSRIEYLESTGTQWIDMGVLPTGTSLWTLSFAFTTVDTNNGCGSKIRLGGMTIRQRNNATSAGSTMLFSCGNNRINYNTFVASDTNRHSAIFNASRGNIYLDGKYRVTTDAAWNNNHNDATLKLFGFIETLGTERVVPAHMRIYSTSITNAQDLQKNPIPKVDLVPVRTGNVGGMFDRISKTLLLNQGTGDFVLGPDV